MRNIGKNIKNLRKSKNMTQEALAEKMCVTRQAISNWENSKTEPDLDSITRLSEIFEVSPEAVIYGRDNKTMNNANTNEKSGAKSKITFDPATKDISIKKFGPGIKNGITFGSALAMVISYAHWQSIGWAIFHGLMSWGYVLYYIIKY